MLNDDHSDDILIMFDVVSLPRKFICVNGCVKMWKNNEKHIISLILSFILLGILAPFNDFNASSN